jgi:hypothetical protein
MDKISKLNGELGRQRAHLEKLVEKKKGLSQKNEELLQKRREILKVLVPGDAKQEKVVLEIERETTLNSRFLEGVMIQIIEAEREVEKARVALAETEAEVKSRLNAFIEQKSNEYFDQLQASLPGELQEILNDYERVCSRLAEFGVKAQRVFPNGEVRTSKEGAEILFALPQRLFEIVQQRGLRKTFLRGYPGSLEIFGLFKRDADGVDDGQGRVNPGVVAVVRHQKRIEQWTKELYQNEK